MFSQVLDYNLEVVLLFYFHFRQFYIKTSLQLQRHTHFFTPQHESDSKGVFANEVLCTEPRFS